MLTKGSIFPGMSTMSMQSSITQGATEWYGKNVNSYTETYYINLVWGNSLNSLQIEDILTRRHRVWPDLRCFLRGRY